MPMMDNKINTILTARYPISLNLGLNHRSISPFSLLASTKNKEESGILAYPAMTGFLSGVRSFSIPAFSLNRLVLTALGVPVLP